MKVRHLLFMGALLLVGASASALPTHRTRPNPTPAGSLNYGQVYYLYNIGAQKFFLGANSYGTRASVGDNGFLVRIDQHIGDDGAWDGKTVTLNDSIADSSHHRWDLTNQAADGASWVDYNSAKNAPDTLWTIVQVGGYYRLSVGAGNPNYTPDTNPDVYYGVKKTDVSVSATAYSPLLYWNLSEADGYVDWCFVDTAEYSSWAKTWAEQSAAYYASEALYAQLQAAEADGVSVADQEAVYNNTAATVEELNAAVQAVKDAIARHAEESVTADNPVDETSFITNPKYADNNSTGWTIVRNGGNSPAVSYHCQEIFNANSQTYSQVIKGLPKGVYALSVNAFYRAGDTNSSYTNYQNGTEQNFKLFAQVGTDTVTAPIKNIFADAVDVKLGTGSEVNPTDNTALFVPNNMQAAEAYFNAGKYNNQLFFSVSGDSTVIGNLKNAHIGNDWTIWTNWQLKYYGKGADAYTMWLKDMVAQTPDYSNLAEDVRVTQSMLDDYNTLKEGYTTASTEAEVIAAYKALTASADSVTTNMALWNQLISLQTQAETQVINDDKIQGDDKEALSDYVGNDLQDILDEMSLSNQELRNTIATLQTMIKTAIDNGISEGTDVTDKYLTNANFETTTGDNTGWTSQHASGGNVAYGGNDKNHCFEAWNNANFDVYQEVEDAPVGVYTISVQGFYRYLRDNNAYTAYTNGTAAQYKDAVKIYVNDNTTSFENVFDEPKEYDKAFYAMNANGTAPNNAYCTPDSAYWFPNNMDDAATAFNNGMYKVSSYGVVANKGDVLRIGVKGTTSQGGDSWSIWDDFHMVYEGTNADVVKPLLQAKAAEVDSVAKVDDNVYGVSELKKANDDIAAGQTAAQGTDGKAMFTALCALIEDETALQNSALVFDTLTTQNETLQASIDTYGETASPTALSTASALWEEITAHLDGKDIETAQAHAYIQQIATALQQLRMPGNYADATKDNPVDFTSVIVNPNYSVDGANSFDGWTQTAGSYNFGNDDTQKGALLIEYYNQIFNMYQTINGLPDGQYQVTVNGFYRYGNAQQDYEHFLAGEANTNAYMYAVGDGTDSVKVALNLLGAGAQKGNGETGTTNVINTNVTPNDTLAVPNNMVSANTWFSQYGQYVNTLDVTVKGGTLTVGIRNNATLSTGNGWVIFDTWTLKYFGNDPTGIRGITEDSFGKAVSTEVYSIDGARQNGLRRGVNIVKFKDAAGKTTVRKVIVK